MIYVICKQLGSGTSDQRYDCVLGVGKNVLCTLHEGLFSKSIIVVCTIILFFNKELKL